MRKFAIASVVIVATALSLPGGTVKSYAAEGPWCHSFGGGLGGIENCRVRTLEECRFEIQGNGGSCSPNPHYNASPPQERTARPGGLYPWPWR
jgi:hypothetical protein